MANLLFLSCLIITLCNLSLSSNVFISIDCGSSVSYKDENGITWTGDDNYVKTGESHSVKSSNSYNHVTDTLRVFTNHTKNCYEIDSVKQGRVLLRATFYYGNYDGKFSPPSFDLMFDANYWGSVNNSGTTPSRYEVIYVTKKESISVCVAQAKAGQFPYISALEIRSLESYMYNKFDDSYPMFTKRRVSFGTNRTIRYPDDMYDRQWTSHTLANGTIKVRGDAHIINGMLSDDNPPPAVLKSAVTTVGLKSSIPLHYMPLLKPSSNVSLYINLYFSEIVRLKPNQIRSFHIYKDNRSFSPPILPPYENCTEMFAGNIIVSSNTSFSLVPTENSTLPPLINAMEVFINGDSEISNGTHNKDVVGLGSLQEAFSSLRDWSGDPCLPKFFNWDWVKCNDEPIPRVTTLLLAGYGLSGLLPDFSSMDALQTINLSNNSLRGNIPDFLGTLPNLKTLNLEHNQLNGTIPASLSTKKDLILQVSGNSELCTSNTSCTTPAISGPPANSSVRKTMNILEMLFATFIALSSLYYYY